jgi:hypothetical protein
MLVFRSFAISCYDSFCRYVSTRTQMIVPRVGSNLCGQYVLFRVAGPLSTLRAVLPRVLERVRREWEAPVLHREHYSG